MLGHTHLEPIVTQTCGMAPRIDWTMHNDRAASNFIGGRLTNAITEGQKRNESSEAVKCLSKTPNHVPRRYSRRTRSRPAGDRTTLVHLWRISFSYFLPNRRFEAFESGNPRIR